MTIGQHNPVSDMQQSGKMCLPRIPTLHCSWRVKEVPKLSLPASRPGTPQWSGWGKSDEATAGLESMICVLLLKKLERKEQQSCRSAFSMWHPVCEQCNPTHPGKNRCSLEQAITFPGQWLMESQSLSVWVSASWWDREHPGWWPQVTDGQLCQDFLSTLSRWKNTRISKAYSWRV